MTADLLFDDVDALSVPSGQRYRVAIGKTFPIKLNFARPPLRWVADRDRVLDIDDDSGPDAVVKTTALGSSLIQVFSGDREVYRLRIIVRERNDQTVTVGMKFTNVRPVEVP